MARLLVIWWVCMALLSPVFGRAGDNALTIQVDFFGDSLTLPKHPSLQLQFSGPLSPEALEAFHQKMNTASFRPLVNALLQYRTEKKLDDWLYYQLVRRTAQQFAPKQENYYHYTLFKWFLLVKSGYDARLNLLHDQLLFYVYSKDEVFNLPLYAQDGKTYVCLNIHDYSRGQQHAGMALMPVNLPEPSAVNPFSYKVTQLPDFNPRQYAEKELVFPYGGRDYHFRLKINPEIKALFANYPVVEYADYFNIPLSGPTYNSLLQSLREYVKGMRVQQGVDYLMKFTRYGFLYEDDQAHFGKEKRMPPEETLVSRASDCDDRAALFFYLVKEIYNLPMIALVYPGHITIAVQFAKPIGQTVAYAGKQYSICEPTPQAVNYSLRRMPARNVKGNYEVVYAYNPQ